MSDLGGWNDGPTTAAILDFVDRVTRQGPDYVAPEDRVAVFDNDGTLWCEKPAYIQLDFIVRRLAQLADDDTALLQQAPYAAAAAGDLGWFGDAVTAHYRGDDSKLVALGGAVLAAFQGMTVEEHAERVRAFFASAQHPSLNRPYTACGYSPMVALAAVPGDPWIHQLHRLRRGSRLHAPGHRRVVRHPAGAGDRQFGRPRLLRRAPPHHLATGVPQRRPGEAGPDLGTRRAATRSWWPGTPTATSRCSTTHAPVSGPHWRCWCSTTTASGSSPTTAGAEQALERAGQQRWTVTSMRDDWATVFDDA